MATIAVIDDNALMRMTLQMTLEAGGFSVRIFDDAEAALADNLDDIDLLLTDLEMPTPGEESIRQLRDRGDQVPIVVLSASVNGRELELYDLGAQVVLSKPVSKRRLLETLNILLGIAV